MTGIRYGNGGFEDRFRVTRTDGKPIRAEARYLVLDYAADHIPDAGKMVAQPQVGGEELVGLAEAARDLLRAQQDDQQKVGFRLDLWNVLQDALAAMSQPKDEVGS